MFQRSKLSLAIAGAVSLSCALASAQETQEDLDVLLEEVVVTGTHIKGLDVAGALPVTQMNKEDMMAVGAVTTGELIANLPQSGGQSFNGESQGPNSARGDVASANLRGLGSGNTLVLLNGRRMVLHPTTQSENSVPVQIVNLNAIPGAGIDRLEVLRDGAGALYGADATAGVLNHVIDADYEGTSITARYGASDGTSLNDSNLNFKWGQSFNGGSTHVSLFGGAFRREGMNASDRDYAKSDDRRLLASGAFEGDSQFRNTSSDSPWGRFRLPSGVSATVNGSSVSSFHVQPCTSGSLATAGNVCLDSGSISDELRANEASMKLMTPDSKRFNIMSMITHEFDSGLELFNEIAYYTADSHADRGGSGVLSSAPITIGADNPYNPFGSGPGRLAGLDPSEIPLSGVELTTSDYRIFDVGNREIDVESEVYRFLVGFRGDIGNWDWETAAVYSESSTKDTESNRVSSSALQAALNSSDPATAYNPFNGGDLSNTGVGDSTLNAGGIADPMRISVTRDSEATLAMYDFKVSTPNLFSLRGHDVGAAFGAEWRRESYTDDRDSRVDGTIAFTNANGDVTSDVVNTSPTPDSDGSRAVYSAYGEFHVPIISESDNIPLVQSLNMQIAGRYESFSDIKEDVLKPKVAASWRVDDWLMFRASYAEGFRAPNLEQVNATEIRRVIENVTDLQACIKQGVISSVSDSVNCNITSDVEDVRAGSKELEPEDSESYSVGLVLDPIENLTLTVDYWHIEQTGIVGLFSASDQMDLDAVLRENGSGLASVTRDPVTGEAISVDNKFLNLGTREIDGVDFGIHYDLMGTQWGDFGVDLNVGMLKSYDQTPSEEAQQLVAAGLSTSAGGSLMKQNDNPYTRASLSINWRKDQWGGSIFTRYVGEVEDTSVQAEVDGNVENWVIDDYTQINASLNYEFEGGSLDKTNVRLGINNLTDEEAPLADETFGFADNLHSNRGRYVYLQVTKDFD